MKKHLLSIAVASTLLAAAFAANASTIIPIPQPKNEITADQIGRAQQKLAHAVQIADRFAPMAEKESLAPGWHTDLVNMLMRQPEANFGQVEAQTSLREAIAMANGTSSSATATPKLLGDVSDDLTYIPLASPCRIVDTRTGGGAVVPGTPRNFTVTPSNTSQGGAGCNPWTGYLGQGSAGAVAANITAIGGPSAPNGAFLRAYEQGAAVPATSWLNFGPSGIVANQGVLPITTSFGFTIAVSSQADAIVDVYGSFVRPQQTPLSCVRVNSTFSVPAGSTASGSGSTCPANYTLTGVGCWNGAPATVTTQATTLYTSTPTAGYTSGGTAFCSASNSGGTASTVDLDAFCCQVPGR